MRRDHPVNTGLTATFTLQSLSVTIPSEIIKEIDDCDSAWTASANVTATVSTARRTDTTRRVSSGEALEFNPTSAALWSQYSPMQELIGRFYVHANKTATFKPFFARTHSDIVIKAVIYGGIVAGIPSDVSVTSTATPASPVTSAAYQGETLSVTPTEDAWIEVWCHCYNLNGNITAKGYWHGYQELPTEV
jgi:hypothetical protein